ncbi:phospholipase D-like domain-containing protein [Nocardioides sp. SYSU D00038]|uniref:phospholipase D-like domain-containing protein n=1 Tax=Nocardioides sp. SYSU D00038 TaxID=2812554 RepID=UPI0019689900|nr:phospholipase D-like domain-containing protein [Nocardioides sp. SYSU D00038]
MTRRLGSLLAAALTAALVLGGGAAPVVAEPGAPRAAAYVPKPGPLFDNEQGTIHQRVIALANGAPRGSSIRLASMTFTDSPVATALINARKRGVSVQVVLAKKTCGGSQPKRLKAAGIRLTCAANGARGSDGTMHIKGASFSSTGGRAQVVLLTSANFTENARDYQHNDAYQSVGWDRFYRWFNAVHSQLMADKARAKPFAAFSDTTASAYATPLNPGQSDPVVNRIAGLPTRGLQIRIAQSAFTGGRARAIADALIAKRRAGATVGFVYAQPNDSAQRSRMIKAGISFARVNWYDSEDDHHFLHHKFMTASWIASNGKRVYRTWMGTEVWTDAAKKADEMVLQVSSPATYRAYYDQFVRLARYATTRP